MLLVLCGAVATDTSLPFASSRPIPSKQMSTISTKIDDLDGKIKIVIGNLLRLGSQEEDKTVGAAVQNVLNAFDPSKDAVVNMRVLCNLARPKLDAFASFIKLHLKGPNGGALFQNREKLAKRIVKEIMSLYPTICDECDHEYQVAIGKKPTLQCYICLQGSHDCEEVVGKMEILTQNMQPSHIGSVWLCSQCLEVNNPYPTESKGKSKPGTQGTNTPTQSETISSEDSSITSLLRTSLEDKLLENQSLEEQSKSKAPGKSENQELEEPKPTPNQSDKVCQRLMDGTCPHGLSGKKASGGIAKCPSLHPTRCKSFMRHGTDKEHGCNEGKNCTKLHTKHCQTSIDKNECLDRACTRSHRVGTRRFKATDRDREPRQSKKNNRNERDRKSSYRRNEADKQFSRPSEKVSDQRNPNLNKKDPFLEFRSMLESMRKDIQTLTVAKEEKRPQLSPQEELRSIRKELDAERQLTQQMRTTLQANSYGHFSQTKLSPAIPQNYFLPANSNLMQPSHLVSC